MTQRIKTEVLSRACEHHLDIRGVDIAMDLLSLREDVQNLLDKAELQEIGPHRADYYHIPVDAINNLIRNMVGSYGPE